MNSDIDAFDVDWDKEHKSRSSDSYDPYTYIYEQDYYDYGNSEMIEDFDWERDD